MAVRQFEEQQHAEVYRQYREKPPETLIQRIISYLREEYKGSLKQAVDLGCGSGQCSFILAKDFEHVFATDVSPSQIQEAEEEKKLRECGNVTFSVSPAESIGLKDNSVQLITACTAAHWFDLEKVYEEGKRVLIPGGVMAFLCIEESTLELGDDNKKNEQLMCIRNKVNHGVLKPYYLPPVNHWYNRYRDITIPYRDLIREFGHGIELSMNVSLSHIIGHIKSLSGFQNFSKNKPQEAKVWLESIKNSYIDIAAIGEADMDKEIFTKRTPYMLVMARL